MAITYKKFTHPKIIQALYELLNPEFKGVYISSKFEEQGIDESIRLKLESVEVLEYTKYHQILEYNTLIRHYYNAPHSRKKEEYLNARMDRLQTHLGRSVADTTNYYDMHISSINYDVQDSENEDNENLHITEIMLSSKLYLSIT